MIPAPATLPLPEIVRRLNAAQPPALLGYPSKLAELAAERQAGRLRITPRTVTAIAELLTPQGRALIEEGFGVPVTDQFPSTEGLAGRSDPGGRAWWLPAGHHGRPGRRGLPVRRRARPPACAA
jgi:phenylacetate-CoA ligase